LTARHLTFRVIRALFQRKKSIPGPGEFAHEVALTAGSFPAKITASESCGVWCGYGSSFILNG
jgi:hypothetical protein